MVIMCITKAQILEWKDVILKINSFQSEEEKMQYLNCHVEDVDLFIATLNDVKKEKLRKSKKRSEKRVIEQSIYEKTEVLKVFQEHKLEEIIQSYSKTQLVAMYQTVFDEKPLTKDKKERVAQKIMGYVRTVSRARALLG